MQELIEAETALEAAQRWLERFERALAEGGVGLEALFQPDCHWRDLLALTWRIQTLGGRSAVLPELRARAAAVRAAGFAIDAERTAPRRVTRAGTQAVEAIFRFDTAHGRASGVVRLTGEAEPRAWTFFTALEELKGFEERIGRRRPDGLTYSREFRGPNWLDLRKASAAFADRDPAVLVVGGGHAGLSIAARLRSLQVDTLVIDRWPRIGDNWRRRYHALTLHNQAHVNHLPYMPFPPNWPAYIPKDKIANWLEAYVEAMEIDYWTGTELEHGAYDARAGRWTVSLRRADGSRRELRPRHVVLATGVSGIPNLPDIPGLDRFAGRLVHSSQYEDGEAWAGKRALVIGTGNSGHDIAQDLHAGGAKVTLVQRSPTHIVNLEPSAQLPYALYDEGPPLEDCDLVTASMPLALARQSHRMLTAQAKKLDAALHAALAKVGFRLDDGDDGTGWQFRYLTRGGGYCFNVGCSDLLARGEIGLVQFADIVGFDAAGARLKSGASLPADLVVLATGYKGQEALVEKLFGAEVATRVGPIWGFGEQQELRNMFTRTAQPGLWLIAGSFAQCRIYSRYLGLQIKASEAGLLPAG
ncbi:MAG: flavin-containing monooxygenase [Burkholderiales bacterium]